MSHETTNFINCFPTIKFKTIQQPKEIELSLTTKHLCTQELSLMLKKAQKDLKKARKQHKHGKITTEELFDYEWYVEEIRQQLNSFNSF